MQHPRCLDISACSIPQNTHSQGHPHHPRGRGASQESGILWQSFFKESLGQRLDNIPNGGFWTPKAVLGFTSRHHGGRREPGANFNSNLCLWHLWRREERQRGIGCPGKGGNVGADAKQQHRGLSPVKCPRQVRWGRGPQEQLPGANGAAGRAAVQFTGASSV